ncbi:MAG: hypothetical protein H7173_12955 [Rhodoferax sp.]|nr:hypothetical protein [Pseudorhodobacter sp.]
MDRRLFLRGTAILGCSAAAHTAAGVQRKSLAGLTRLVWAASDPLI